jgi:hypothetical protein
MSETFNYDQLIAGPYPMVTGEVTVASGQNLARGSVLGLSASGVTVLGKAYLNDILETVSGVSAPYAVLLEAVDASGGDVEHCPVALTGEFNKDKLVFASGTTFDHVQLAMRALCMYGKDALDVSGT